VLDEATPEQVRAEAAELMRTEIADAEAEPPADISLLFEHAYAEPLPSFEEELRELRDG
jgi:TPP-dependent pyruvate/acetoin dehydrogenase alpha subunit